MEFAKRLKQLRGEKGISQTKLAADIHISRSAVAKWENGLGMPSDESLQMLAEYFGIDPTLVRLGWALLSLCGPGIVAYIIAMIVMPQAPENPELKEEPKDDSKE